MRETKRSLLFSVTYQIGAFLASVAMLFVLLLGTAGLALALFHAKPLEESD